MRAKVINRTFYHGYTLIQEICLCVGAMRTSLLGSNSEMLHLLQRFSALREQRYLHSTP